jgi:hypothetical protein
MQNDNANAECTMLRLNAEVDGPDRHLHSDICDHQRHILVLATFSSQRTFRPCRLARDLDRSTRLGVRH